VCCIFCITKVWLIWFPFISIKSCVNLDSSLISLQQHTGQCSLHLCQWHRNKRWSGLRELLHVQQCSCVYRHACSFKNQWKNFSPTVKDKPLCLGSLLSCLKALCCIYSSKLGASQQICDNWYLCSIHSTSNNNIYALDNSSTAVSASCNITHTMKYRFQLLLPILMKLHCASIFGIFQQKKYSCSN